MVRYNVGDWRGALIPSRWKNSDGIVHMRLYGVFVRSTWNLNWLGRSLKLARWRNFLTIEPPCMQIFHTDHHSSSPTNFCWQFWGTAYQPWTSMNIMGHILGRAERIWMSLSWGQTSNATSANPYCTVLAGKTEGSCKRYDEGATFFLRTRSRILFH